MVTQDILWKGIIEDMFEEFMWYFFPEFSENKADFSKPIQFLDKELQSLLPESERNARHADKLVKIPVKNKNDNPVIKKKKQKATKNKKEEIEYVYFLLHIEVQGYTDVNFAERMFEYYYRIRERWKTRIFTLVLYTEGDKNFHPKKFYEHCEETNITYNFKTFKLLDQSEEILNVPKNPFSVVMRVAYKALQKSLMKNDQAQLKWKIGLVKEIITELEKENYSSSKIHNILNFIRFYTKFSDKESDKNLDFKIEEITKQNANNIMGIEEAIKNALRQEGEAKGEAKGEVKGEAKSILKCISKGMKIHEVAELFDLSIDYVKEIIENNKF